MDIINLLTAKDFIGVRAELVRAFGGDANRALVLTRIFFRADERWRESIERDDHWWWRATYQTIADETGLSVKQVERCLKWLGDEGYLVTAKHHVEGSYDQTRSYRVVGDSPISGDDSPEAGNVDSPNSGDVPTYQTVKKYTSEPKTVKTLDGPKTAEEIAHAFGLFWTAYPRHIGKAAALKAFEKAVTKARAKVIIDAAKLYRRSVGENDPKFIAHPTTWLNQERWEDDLGPVEGTGINAIRSL